MRYIDHIVEPTKLLLAWQSSDEEHRTRYVVGEISRNGNEIGLVYLTNTRDFGKAQALGFDGYPAFQDIGKNYGNVLDAFMRRLPPRTRGDFTEYLKGLRLRSDAKISDFALLGYSGAKLLSDGFSIIHPFNNVDGPCELLLEAAGYRHRKNKLKIDIQIDSPASFHKDYYEPDQEDSISINIDGNCIGYVNRGLIPTFIDWINNERIVGSWVEKMNGTPGMPTLYLYVKVSAK